MRAVPRFFARQTLGATPLNRIVDELNEVTAPRVGTEPNPGFMPWTTALFEITSIGTFGELECVGIGLSAEPTALRYTVLLPPIYAETSRGGVTYAYINLNTRTASDGGTNPDETQYLTPPLTVGEPIIAVDATARGGWVMFGDGRMWAVDPP